VVDQLTKIAHFISTTEKTSAEGLARLFRDNVWKLYGLPKSIISDRAPQFIVGLIQELNKILGIESKMSTAFVRATGAHKTPGESSVILQFVIMIQLTFRRILRD